MRETYAENQQATRLREDTGNLLSVSERLIELTDSKKFLKGLMTF